MYTGSKLWNSLSISILEAPCIFVFKRACNYLYSINKHVLVIVIQYVHVILLLHVIILLSLLLLLGLL